MSQHDPHVWEEKYNALQKQFDEFQVQSEEFEQELEQDKLLVENLSLSINYGESVLVVGPSGCGKTSLLRVISGLCDTDSGEVFSPTKGDLLFIPQKPYMNLRLVLCHQS